MRFAYPAVLAGAIACASAPSTARLSTTGPRPPAPTAASAATSTTTNGRGQILTGSFMTEYFAGESLYDVLRVRAPLYLRVRPNPSAELTNRADPLAVYVDGLFSGSTDVLQLIPAHDVYSVKRLSAADAAIRFGPKHNSGALLVTLTPRTRK